MGLNSVDHGVDQVLWLIGSQFLAPVVLPTGFFLVLFLICSMVNMHNEIHPIKYRVDVMPNGGATCNTLGVRLALLHLHCMSISIIHSYMSINI